VHPTRTSGHFSPPCSTLGVIFVRRTRTRKHMVRPHARHGSSARHPRRRPSPSPGRRARR
jgi:hypothetical protein